MHTVHVVHDLLMFLKWYLIASIVGAFVIAPVFSRCVRLSERNWEELQH